MRFLCVSLGLHPDIVGGAWRVAAEQCAGLALRGHSVEVITAHPGSDLPASETRDGVTIHRYTTPPGGFASRWRAANRAARNLIQHRLAASPTPTVLLQHHAYLGPATRRLPASFPILHVFHGPWAEEYRLASRTPSRSPFRRLLDTLIPRLLHRVEGQSLRKAGHIIVLSRHFEQGLHRWHPGPLPGVEVVPGGVDFRRFLPPANRTALRTEWGLEPDAILAVAVRRLDPRMGLDLLIEAFARIAPEAPRAHLWLTGRGPAESDLRTRIARHNLGNRVRLLGFLPDADVPRLLGAADFTLMPSLDLEGFGLATAESLACGTPVLGSRAGATPELLDPLDPGLLFAPGSVDDLERRLRAAILQPGGLPARERCACFARDRFSWDHQVLACERAASRLAATRSA